MKSPGSQLPDHNRGILSYFVQHRTAANLLLVLMIVAGLAASTRIRAQFFPDVAVEQIAVSIAWPGAGPAEMDEAVVARLEPQLRTVEGVKDVAAVSRTGSASITLEFNPSTDMSQALDDVKAAVDQVSDLPEDIDEPVIRPNRWRDRVTDVLVSGNVDVDALKRIAEEVRTELFRQGVTLVELDGISAPEIRIDVRPADLERYGLSLNDISEAIKAETGTLPVGEIERTGARVRAASRPLTAEALSDIAIRAGADGSKVLLRDVADVGNEGIDREIALYENGKAAVLLAVDRDAQGDALAIQAKVEKAVAAIQPTLTAGVEVKLVHPRAQAISDRLDILIKNGLSGLAVVIVLLFLFLSSRTAFWVTAGIPVAMAATIALMYAFGFTLNMVSLFALIICLGIVVDDAIVVGEHADHLARSGMPPEEAAASAARRMAAPVFAASITTVVAFAVLGLIGGRFGRMIADMPFTVAVVILASLVESFLILPAHMRHALAHNTGRSLLDLPSTYVNRGFDWFRENIFRRIVRTAVSLRYPVIATGLLLLSVSVGAVVDKTVRWQFFSSPERATIRANLAMLDSASRADTLAMVAELDRALKAVDERYAAKYGTAPVKVAIAKVGATSGRGLKSADTKEPDRLASYDIELIDPDDRTYSAFDFIQDWQDEIARHPLLETLALRGDRSGPGGDAIDVRLSGASETTLKAAAESLKAALARYPAATGIEDDMAYDRPELMIRLNAKGQALGFTTQSIAAALRQRLDGVEAVKLARDDSEVVAKVRLPNSELGASFMHQATLPMPAGGFVALTEIATFEEIEGFSSIRRENGERRIQVSGDLSDDPEAAAETMAALRDTILPDVASSFGVRWTLGGLAEQENEFLSDATIGLFAALVGIYCILAWVFASWTRPLIVMLVIPFGLIGAIWGHWLHATPLSMFSVVGLIGMAGIIINDSIVLVTAIDEKTRTRDMLSSIIDGTADRLRAVMLTTLTTVGGLAPLLLETSRQAQFLKPTVITLAYGLGFGMLLVLILTPAMLAIQHDIAMQLKSFRRAPRLRARAKTITTDATAI
ncbi:MAG: efflux RND transporter permease subunit [Alphaproteobacteria bacterium]|nr:efflux RND transporter permease subunit [Alphaproteobacteria bacterium]